MRQLFCLLTVLTVLLTCPAARAAAEPGGTGTEAGGSGETGGTGTEAGGEEPQMAGPSMGEPATFHNAYIKGRGGARFAPREALTRAEAASLFAELFPSGPDGVRAADFADLPRDAWYTAPISWLCSLGMMKGYGDGTIRPEAPITRAEFVTMLNSFFLPKPSARRFTDVPSGHWAEAAIAAAADRGWVRGYGKGVFRPDRSITRAEAVTALNAALGRGTEQLTEKQLLNRPFVDVRPGDWFYGAVVEAAAGHAFGYQGGKEYWAGFTYRPCGYPRGVQRIGGAFYLVNDNLQIDFLQPGLQTIEGRLYLAAADGSIPVDPDGIVTEGGVVYRQQADGSLVKS